MKGKIMGIFEPLIREAKLACWPVGSVYMSMQATSPAELFGGTWARMEGQFLLGATTSDLFPPLSMGGEAEHALYVHETPAHFHSVAYSSTGLPSESLSGNGIFNMYEPVVTNIVTDTRENAYWTTNTTMVGSGAAHNNMPPYIAVYMWRRTA